MSALGVWVQTCPEPRRCVAGGLDPNATYAFYVVATNVWGMGDFSDVYSVRTRASNAPSAPTAIGIGPSGDCLPGVAYDTCNPSGGRLTVVWTGSYAARARARVAAVCVTRCRQGPLTMAAMTSPRTCCGCRSKAERRSLRTRPRWSTMCAGCAPTPSTCAARLCVSRVGRPTRHIRNRANVTGLSSFAYGFPPAWPAPSDMYRYPCLCVWNRANPCASRDRVQV